jgi:hypothetical protein
MGMDMDMDMDIANLKNHRTLMGMNMDMGRPGH